MANKETENKENKEKQSDNRSALKEIYEAQPNTIRLSALGFIIAISFLIIGFWATLLIILLTGAGFVYGQYKDKKTWVYKLLKKFFKQIK